MRRFLNRSSIHYNLGSILSNSENIYYTISDKTNRWIMKMKKIGKIIESEFKYSDLDVQVIRVSTYDKSSFVSASIDTSNEQYGYFLTFDTIYRIQLDPLLFNSKSIITLPPEFNAQGQILVDSLNHVLYCIGFNGIIIPIDISQTISVTSIYSIVITILVLLIVPLLCLIALAVNFQKLRSRMLASRTVENDMRRLLTEMVEYKRSGEHRDWIIDTRDLKITHRIAEGASGVVFKVFFYFL